MNLFNQCITECMYKTPTNDVKYVQEKKFYNFIIYYSDNKYSHQMPCERATSKKKKKPK